MLLEHRIFAGIFLLASTLLQGQPPPGDKATIAGTAVNAITGDPLPGVRVILGAAVESGVPSVRVRTLADGTGLFSPVPTEDGATVSANTKQDGSFTIENLDPGSYVLIATANGYVRWTYGQRAVSGSGVPITVAAGQALKDLAIRLVPESSIRGRASNDLGQAAVGVSIELLRAAYTAQGRTFQSVSASSTNDRGEYRLFGIPPGRYYLLIGNQLGRTEGPYAVAFYPGSSNVERATSIDLKAGEERTLDVSVRKAQRYRIRGRVIPPAGQTGEGIHVRLNYQRIGGGGGGSIGAGRYDPKNGNFEIETIPGSYVLQAQMAQPGVLPSVPRQLGPSTGYLPVTLVDSDVNDIILTFAEASIDGRVSLEGQELPDLPGSDRIRVALTSSVAVMGDIPIPQAQINAAGKFSFSNVGTGEYRVRVSGLPQGLYIKRVEYRGEDVQANPFSISSAVSGTIDIVVRSGAAQLSGSLVDAQSRPAQNQVIVIPDDRSRTDLVRVVTTDRLGRFTITGLPPGPYKVFSWESLEEQGAYFDPKFTSRYEEAGRAVLLSEASKADVEMKIIPE